ncbi:MAG: DUF3298 domain-containing protein [Patescibacteria group bacterium]
MRYFPALLLATLIVMGAGCNKTPQPVVLQTQPDRVPETLAGDVDVQAVELKKSFVLNEYASCELKITYPTFPAGSLPEKVGFQVDHEIAHFIAEALGHNDEIDSTHELEDIADDYLAGCQSGIETEYNHLSAADADMFTNLKRSVEVIYSVKINQHHLLSIGLEEYSYTGGAHPNQHTTYFNIDRGNDKLLTLGDLLAPEQLANFVKFEKSKLLVENQDNLYPETIEEYEALINTATPATAAEQTAKYAKLTNFFLTPTSLNTYYNSYDIAPYVAGPIEASLNYTDIADYLQPGGVLDVVLEQLR